MKTVLITADGLGNIFECLPVVTTLEREKGWRVNIAVIGANYAIDERVLGDRYIPMEEAVQCDLVIATGKAYRIMCDRGIYPRRIMVGQAVNKVKQWTRSEVDVRLDICRDLGCMKLHYGYEIQTAQIENPYDIVIANGYNVAGNPKDCWCAKQYRRWAEAVGMIKQAMPGITIASLGTDAGREYVEGTDNLIGLPLEQTLGHVKAAGLLLSNDTGLYHAAALLGTRTLVYFSFTDQTKNHDLRFHNNATIISRQGLACQAGCWKSGRVKHCNDRQCQDCDPRIVAQTAMRAVTGGI